MQKFTIFSIIFAVIVLSITAELVTQDYLSKLYPSSASANLLTNLDNLDSTPPASFDEIKDIEPITDTTPVTETVENIDLPVNDDTQISGVSVKVSQKVVDLLPSLDIPNIKYQPVNFSGKVFDVIETDVNPDDVALGQLVLGEGANKNVLGAVYEFTLKHQQDARKLYTQIKTQAKTITSIDVNETNQFGDNSFYLNHKAKINEVFVVTISGNSIFALAYSKQYHETFKPFMGLLL